MSGVILPESGDLMLVWGRILSSHWPDLYAKLGVRSVDYLDAARRKADVYLFVQDAVVARYINLCCALGPNFEDKPENEWALSVLADDRLEEWVKLHQLVIKGVTVLGRHPDDGRRMAAQFLRADAALLDFHDAQRKATHSDAEGLARVACDLDAVDIRVLEIDWRLEYSSQNGIWQLVNAPVAETSVRMGPGLPAPTQISVLTHAPRLGAMARLQVRLLVHSRCNQDFHPLVTFAGVHGLLQWRGHLAQAVSWQVSALSPTAAAQGMGAALFEETIPDIAWLRIISCGVRDDGVPTGLVQTHVWAYPASQYLFVLERAAGDELRWPRSPECPSGAGLGMSRCRLECDGAQLVCTAWTQGFQENLHCAVYIGLNKLFAAWQCTTKNATMRSSLALLTGQATLTWGWREGVGGLAGPPFMRVAGELNMNHLVDLELTGEVEWGVTRTRVRLVVKDEAPMKHVVAREAAQPGLIDTLLGVTVCWQMQFSVEFDPIAVDDAAMWYEAGPCTGSVIGEVGLRPRLLGSGWQWYARMHCESVSVPIRVHDPVLGQTQKILVLLPGVDLLDWSLG